MRAARNRNRSCVRAAWDWVFGSPFEKGAACRFKERRASSSALRNRSISPCAFFNCSRSDRFSLRSSLFVGLLLDSLAGFIELYSNRTRCICPACSYLRQALSITQCGKQLLHFVAAGACRRKGRRHPHIVFGYSEWKSGMCVPQQAVSQADFGCGNRDTRNPSGI